MEADRTLTRVGLWALPIAGVLIAVPWLAFITGPTDLARDPDGYVRALTSPIAAAAWYGYPLGLVCLVFGLLALYDLVTDSHARSLALAGPLVGVAATALLLAPLGVFIFAGPIVGDVYQAGHKEVVEALKPLAGGALPPRILWYYIAVILLGAVAAVASGSALWRSGRVPRWAGVVFAVGFLLCILSAPIVTPTGALLVLLGGAWMAGSLGERAFATRPATAVPATVGSQLA